MKSLTIYLLVVGVIGFSKAALTSEETDVGDSIASTLDNLISPSGSGGSKQLMAASWFRPKSRYYSHRRPSSIRYLDFMLVLDSSGSIGAEDFKEGKEATEVIVDYIDNKAPISSAGSRVGLVQFSSLSKTRVVFHFGDYNTAREVKRKIGALNYVGGMTATNKALTLTETEFNRNGRFSNAKVVWILTDGKSNSGGSPIPVAERLINMDATVCAVAIGDNVNMKEINDMASPNCVFKLTSFSKYKAVMQYAYAKSGGAAKPPAKPQPLDSSFFSGIQFRK